MTWRLIALIAIPTAMGLTFGVIRVATADSAANQFGQIETLANLGQPVIGLANSLDDERDLSAGYAAAGRPASANQQLQRQYAVTESWVTRVRAALSGLSPGYLTEARVQGVQQVLDLLPQTRTTTTKGKAVSGVSTVDSYNHLTALLQSYTDDIAPGSTDPALVDGASALGSAARLEDDISQQRALIYTGLIEHNFEDGATQGLTQEQALQFIDTDEFLSFATPGQQQLYYTHVANVGDTLNAEQTLVTNAISVGSPARLGFTAGTWYTSMSGMLGNLRGIEQQVTASVVARAQQLHQGAEDSAALSAILSALLLLAALAATFAVARSIVRPLRTLRGDALQIATARLPEKVLAISAAEDPAAEPDVTPVSVSSADEIGQVARAFDQVHREAVKLAANEAVLRRSMNAIFVNLSRRGQSLQLRLASLIDSLEQSEDDPGRLASLFTMDHLVTRMRRHSENLLVLAGHEPARRQAESVPLPDVVRAAVSEILEYDRVEVSVQPDVSIAGQSASDIVHLLAEILENATVFSAKEARVRVTGEALTSGGALIDVTDSGMGIAADRLTEFNIRLDNPPAADVSVSRHMGLFAVSHLAERHGVRVRLRPAEPHGVSALVWIPEQLIKRERPVGWQRVMGTTRRPRVYDSLAPEWFQRGKPLADLAPAPVPAREPAIDAGWRMAAAATEPVHDGLTTAGLPQRTPRANLIPGAAGDRPRAGDGGSGPAARSADRARSRLSAFQRGSLRAEHVNRPGDR